MKLLGKIFFLCLLVGGFSVYYFKDAILSKTQNKSPNIDFKTGSVSKGDITVSVTAAGNIFSAKSTIISAPYNGYVRKVFINVGDKVQKGDPLVSIAESTFARSQDIFPLRAPFSGTVVSVLVNEGQQVKTGNDGALLRVEDLSSFHVMAELPEIDYIKINKSLGAKIRVSAVMDKTYKGVISEIDLASKSQDRWDRGKVVFPIKVAMLGFDKSIKPGMSVLVDIIVAEKKGVLLLGHEFIEKTRDGYQVTMLDGKKKPVKLGLQNEMTAEILEGVASTDRVKMVDFLNSGEEML